LILSKEITLTKGYVATVDDEDFECLSKFKWSTLTVPGKSPYAKRTRRGILMHRVIMGINDRRKVDHINGDGLDNRRENLRVCTNSQNSQNMKPRDGATKGLYFHKKNLKWCAQIMQDRVKYHLGSFDTKEAAQARYDEEAIKRFGNFACTSRGREGAKK
jgi:hypothetical protein